MRRLIEFFRHIASNKYIISSFLAIVVFIILNILSGLIGNSAYSGTLPSWLRDTLKSIKMFLASHLLSMTSFISVFGIIAIIILVLRNRSINRALNLTDNLAKLDDSLLRLMTNSIVDMHKKNMDDLRKERRRLLYELLRDATETMLGDKNKGRAIIVSPGAQDGDQEFLTILAYHKVSELTVKRTRFYIGNDVTKNFERGTVGVAYLERHVRIGNMLKKGDRWECTDENYYVFDERRVAPPYETFINVPIIGPSKNGDINCLGVLCMDTMLYNAFHSRRAKVTIEAISRRIASVLSIYDEIITPNS